MLARCAFLLAFKENDKWTHSYIERKRWHVQTLWRNRLQEHQRLKNECDLLMWSMNGLQILTILSPSPVVQKRKRRCTTCAHCCADLIKMNSFDFVLLQLSSQRRHTGAACPASALSYSTVRLWETKSGWARGVDWQRGWAEHSRTAWCSAAARWRSRRGSIWGWRKICLTGMELCVWASPTCRPQTDLGLCPPWPSQTSLTRLDTGLFLCSKPAAKPAQSWSSGCLMEAAYMSKVAALANSSWWQEWIWASHCGPW